MHLKKYFKFFLILFLPSFLSAIVFHEPTIRRETFGVLRYQIVLFDLKKFIVPILDRCTEEIKPGNVLGLTLRNRNGFVGFSQNLEGILNQQTTEDAIVPEQTLNYANRISKTLEVVEDLSNKKFPLILVKRGGRQKNLQKRTIYTQDEFYVPAFEVHERTNLFDGFPTAVDEKILDYGICEWITHKNKNEKIERQLQITIFGGMILPRGLTTLGFFQYTYSPSTNCFYHRCFRPWTSYYLQTISNSYTQVVIRSALLYLFKGLIDPSNTNGTNLSTTELKIFMEKFLTSQEAIKGNLNLLLRAGRTCRDPNFYPSIYEYFKNLGL